MLDVCMARHLFVKHSKCAAFSLENEIDAKSYTPLLTFFCGDRLSEEVIGNFLENKSYQSFFRLYRRLF